MEHLHGGMGIRELRRRLGEAGHGVLMLDFDGTLAPFRTDPSAVEPYPGVTGLLESLVRQGTTRLVIVTGRSVADGLPQLPTAVPLELWGVHGRERRLTDGSYRLAPLPEPALEALVTADDWSAEVEALGCRVERKPGTIAFHWRGLDGGRAAAIRRQLGERWPAVEGRLRWLEFDGGVELAAPGPGKAAAVTKLLAESGPGTPVAFLGDDRTDEDAFIALRDRGLGVLVRPEFRPTAADLWLRPPGELLEFLAAWGDCLARGR